MPLSEHEQKILHEIERDLYREDPTFARDVRRSSRLADSTKARLGALLFVAGFVVLILFFVVSSLTQSAALSLALGVGAFAAMVAGIVVFVSSVRSRAARERERGDRFLGALRRLEARLRERYKRPT